MAEEKVELTPGADNNGDKQLIQLACTPEKVAVIFNPVSGTQDCSIRRSLIQTVMSGAGISCDIGETDRDRGATPLAEKAVHDGVERLLVSGGDGSITEAANALLGTNVALGVLPGGTGNLLALNLGLPLDPGQAAEMALTAPVRRMDVGRANGTVFLIMVGMGVDGRMIRDADRKMKQRLGVLAYFVAAVRNLGRQFHRYEVTVDGQRIRRRAQTVLVANLGRITAGVELVPGSDPHDGMLDVAILRAHTLPQMAKVLLRALAGHNHSDRLLEVHHGRHIVIRTTRPQPVQVDGNEAGFARRLEVDIEPGALPIVCPPCADGSAVATPAEAIAAMVHVPPFIPLAAGVVIAAVSLRDSTQDAWGTAAIRGAGAAVGAFAAAAVVHRLRDNLRRRQPLIPPAGSCPLEPAKAPAPENKPAS